ncbi:Hypothetical_protein [Hexamita inflata]|uniref:Hypothetical_protein n=1 Tax=Hexamita inflata TaxID=28002 RepID=A0AA86Q7L8_9EUKA|nr:Hypothetical protein HINF_LOCUS40438 [Hexamita inflata]
MSQMYHKKYQLPQLLERITNSPQLYCISPSSSFFKKFQQSVEHLVSIDQFSYDSQVADKLKQTKIGLQESIKLLNTQLRKVLRLEQLVQTADRNLKIVFNNQKVLQIQL